MSRDGPEDPSDRIGHEGITQMVVQDDSWVWAASGSSSVKRWWDVPPKARRAGAILRRAEENGDVAVPEDRATDSPVAQENRTSSSPPAMSPSSPERDRPGPHSVSFLEGLTSPLGRTSSSPTPRPTLSLHLGSTPRPSSLRTPRQSLISSTRPPVEQLLSANPTTCCDIPYDSLIPLTLPEDTYFAPAFASRYRDPDAATIYSTVSVVSGSGVASSRPQLVGASSSSYRRPVSLADTAPDATNIAQREYLERESAAEATPLRSAPDDVIEGGYGLVRCELLNDRQHALTQDTEDEIALWDIVRGTCLGVFSRDELQDAAAQRRPSDAGSALAVNGRVGHGYDLLEYVRERTEGEVSIATWCKCDTRTGALAVHLEEARVFDAESYIEECGVGPPEDYPPDHRVSLGKWVLRQLFDGFVEAEMAARVPNSVPPPSALFGTEQRDGAPAFISLAGLPPPPATPLRAKGPRTPGMTIALATPALKKAVLPDLPTAAGTSPRFGNTELAPIPQSPLAQTPMAALATPSGGKTPTLERPEGDYFSLRPAQPEPLSPLNVPLSTPGTGARGNEPSTPTATSPSLPTQQGGTIMGRLRAFGKNSKKASTAPESVPLATPVQHAVPADVRSASFFPSLLRALTVVSPNLCRTARSRSSSSKPSSTRSLRTRSRRARSSTRRASTTTRTWPSSCRRRRATPGASSTAASSARATRTCPSSSKRRRSGCLTSCSATARTSRSLSRWCVAKTPLILSSIPLTDACLHSRRYSRSCFSRGRATTTTLSPSCPTSAFTPCAS